MRWIKQTVLTIQDNNVTRRTYLNSLWVNLLWLFAMIIVGASSIVEKSRLPRNLLLAPVAQDCDYWTCEHAPQARVYAYPANRTAHCERSKGGTGLGLARKPKRGSLWGTWGGKSEGGARRVKVGAGRKRCFEFKQALKVVATSSTVGNLTKEAVKLMQAKVWARSVGVWTGSNLVFLETHCYITVCTLWLWVNVGWFRHFFHLHCWSRS